MSGQLPPLGFKNIQTFEFIFDKYIWVLSVFVGFPYSLVGLPPNLSMDSNIAATKIQIKDEQCRHPPMLSP